MIRHLLVFAIGVAVAASAGCSVKSTQTVDPNFRACIDAGGSYSEPVDDSIGFRCDLPGGAS